MPEEMRLDVERDLTPEGVAEIIPILEEIAELEYRWTNDLDEVAYARWRELVTIATEVVERNRSGGQSARLQPESY